MPRRLLAGMAAAGAVGLFGASAHADPFVGLYGNTASSTAPDGRKTLYYFNRDGTFENHLPSGRVIKGVFAWKDSQTACFTVTDPPPPKNGSATNCRPFPISHHVGDTWTETDSQGVAYLNSITAGR